jgi:hypothetical protein
MSEYPESVKILISFEKDAEGNLKSCKIYSGSGKRLGFTQTKLQDDMFSGTFETRLYIKDTIEYIKSEIKK